MQCSYRPCVLLWLGTLLLVSLPRATADGLEWSGTTIIIVCGSAAGGVLLVIGGIVAYVLLHKQSSKVQAKQADDQHTSTLEPGMDIELGGAKAVSPWVTPHNSPGASGQLLAQPWQPQQQPHEQQQQQLQPWQQQQQQQQQQGTLVQPFDNAADHSQEDDGQYRGEEALAVEDFEAEEDTSHTEKKKKKKKKKKDKDTEGGKKKKKKKHSNSEYGEEAA